MDNLLTLHDPGPLTDPVMVVMLEGWVDAGEAASTAMQTMVEAGPTTSVVTFDADELIDHRARRPMIRIVEGVEEDISWPEPRIDLSAGYQPRSVLLLHGPEPDMRWRRFADEMVGTVKELGVQMVIGLGAFPAPVPHTRPVLLTGTSTSEDLAARVGTMPATINVPAGAQSMLEWSFGQAGIPAVGIWARVPHYAAALPYPAASAALLKGLSQLAGIEVDTASLNQQSEATRTQIDGLIAASDEHTMLVKQLEEKHDSEVSGTGDITIIPSGDQLAAELEHFLRGQD